MLIWLLSSMLLFLKTVPTAVAQDCLQAAPLPNGTLRSPPFRNGNFRPLPDSSQAIITSYQFQCCGNITEWQTYVHPGRQNYQEGSYDITFHVWRPSPTVEMTGCYSLVGENRFTDITLIGRGLVRQTPTVSNRIPVRPGDVLGYYSFSTRGVTKEGIQLDREYQVDSVWFQTTNGREPRVSFEEECPFPIGTQSSASLSSFTSRAPMLQVGLDAYSCITRPTEAINMATTAFTLPSPSSTPTNSNFLQESTTSSAINGAVIASIAAACGTAFLLTLLCVLALTFTAIKINRRKSLPPVNHSHEAVNTDGEETGNNIYTTSDNDENYETIVPTNYETTEHDIVGQQTDDDEVHSLPDAISHQDNIYEDVITTGVNVAYNSFSKKNEYEEEDYYY